MITVALFVPALAYLFGASIQLLKHVKKELMTRESSQFDWDMMDLIDLEKSQLFFWITKWNNNRIGHLDASNFC